MEEMYRETKVELREFGLEISTQTEAWRERRFGRKRSPSGTELDWILLLLKGSFVCLDLAVSIRSFEKIPPNRFQKWGDVEMGWTLR